MGQESQEVCSHVTRDWTAGNAWQADHIVPVYEGGGLCDLTNFRTLCTVCHGDETAKQATARARARHAANTPTLPQLYTRYSQSQGSDGDFVTPATRARPAKRKLTSY